MDTLVPEWQRRSLVRAGYRVVKKLESFIAKADLKRNQPFFDCSDYPWIERLERNWRMIAEELPQIVRHRDHLPHFQDISQDQVSIQRAQKLGRLSVEPETRLQKRLTNPTFEIFPQLTGAT